MPSDAQTIHYLIRPLLIAFRLFPDFGRFQQRSQRPTLQSIISTPVSISAGGLPGCGLQGVVATGLLVESNLWGRTCFLFLGPPLFSRAQLSSCRFPVSLLVPLADKGNAASSCSPGPLPPQMGPGEDWGCSDRPPPSPPLHSRP